MNESRDKVLDVLQKREWHITFAESCTGGMLAASLVDMTAISPVFNQSYVTYSNEAKSTLLGVREETLATFGAVSVETAAEMAEGAAKNADAEVAVAVSGIAGPSGATEDKPIGTVAFGFFVDGKIHVRLKHFGDLGRNAVRQATVEYAWRELLSILDAHI